MDTVFRNAVLILFLSPAALAAQIGQYHVYELTVSSAEQYANPFTEAALHVKFEGPGNRVIELAGFHYKDKEWRARFVPDKPGTWHYSAELRGKGEPVRSSGAFECVPSPRHSFVRLSKLNPYRFEYDDGTPFYPICQQIGWGVGPKVGFDAPDASAWVNTDCDTFMKAFTGATNLMRCQLGCGNAKAGILSGAEGLDRYDLEKCLNLDASCRRLKDYEWAQILTLFEDMSLWGDAKTAFGSTRDLATYKTLKSPHLPAMEAYVKYMVARYAAYVDIWELYNEDSYSPNDFLAHLAQVVRQADPYKHPIMTNYERPAERWCEILSVHEYMGLPAAEVPGYLSKEFARFKSFGKPVLYTEFGNQAQLGNDDPVKWRVAVWTAFMNECAMGFWNMSGRKVPPKDKGGPVNAYLGLESRQAFRVLAETTRDLPVAMRPTIPGFTSERPVQSWALTNGEKTIVYVHHFRNHEETVKLAEPLQVWTGPGSYHVKWLAPATGAVVEEFDAQAAGNILPLRVPEFKIDLAARIARTAQP